MQKMILVFFGTLTIAAAALAHPAQQTKSGQVCVWRPGITNIFVSSSQSFEIVSAQGSFTVTAPTCWDLESAFNIQIRSFGDQLCTGDQIIADQDICYVGEIAPL